MASYPFLSQAPTPVEVELGCDNINCQNYNQRPEDTFPSINKQFKVVSYLWLRLLVYLRTEDQLILFTTDQLTIQRKVTAPV